MTIKIAADNAIPFIRHYFDTVGEKCLLETGQIIPENLSGTDVLVVRTVTPVNETLLGNSKVKIVASASSGFDHVDMEFLEENGIGFFYSPGCNANSVAEYVLSALLVLSEQHDVDLDKKTFAVIGCGNVGSRVRRFIEILGLSCVVCDPFLKMKTGDDQYMELDEVLAADIISLHVPLTRDGPYPTFQMVNNEFLDRLKKDVILINTSRGDVINEAALLQFLDKNNKPLLVLDVWANEPGINHSLLSRVHIGTPHIAGYSIDGKLKATQMVFTQVCDNYGLESDTKLDPVLPRRHPDELLISEYESEMDAIKMAVLASYDVRSDCSALLQTLELNKAGQELYFTELRNNYPVRREFNSLKIKLSSGSDTLHNKLTQLGFHLSS